LLHEVLQDGSGTFLGKLSRSGSSRAFSSLRKAPCDGFGVDLGSKAFANRSKAGDSQGATKGCKGSDYRQTFQGPNERAPYGGASQFFPGQSSGASPFPSFTSTSTHAKGRSRAKTNSSGSGSRSSGSGSESGSAKASDGAKAGE
jgi:hypothetical protein